VRGDEADLDVDVRTHRAGREVKIQPAAGRDVTDVLDRGRLDHGWIDAKKRQAHEGAGLGRTGCKLRDRPFVLIHIGEVFLLFLRSLAPCRVERFPGAKRAPQRLEDNDDGRLRAVEMHDGRAEQVGILGRQRSTQVVRREYLPGEGVGRITRIANQDLHVNRETFQEAIGVPRLRCEHSLSEIGRVAEVAEEQNRSVRPASTQGQFFDKLRDCPLSDKVSRELDILGHGGSLRSSRERLRPLRSRVDEEDREILRKSQIPRTEFSALIGRFIRNGPISLAGALS